MRPSVALVAAGARGNSAVGSRIGAFARELGRRGWDVTVIDPASPSATMADRLLPHMPTALRSIYERLHQADAAVVTMDTASAVESRIPAKVYDYLATGVPVIAVCPPSAALLRIPEAGRFHHVHHQDTTGLTALLRHAMRDRATLRPGMPGEGPTREHGAITLHTLLRSLAQQL